MILLYEILFDLKNDICNFLFRKSNKIKNRNKLEIEKWRSYYFLMLGWNRLVSAGKSIAEYLCFSECQKVAIYGCGDIGKLCCDRLLEDEKIKIVELLDRTLEGKYKNIPIVKPQNISNEVEAVIITPICDYMNIAGILSQYTNAKFISLEDMVMVLLELSEGAQNERE